MEEDYGFAKRHGVLVVDLQPDLAKVVHRSQPNAAVLMELRRHLRRPLHIEEISQEAFDELLTNTYENQTFSARQVAESMGDDLDLSTLIQELPRTEDLLESQDDAPIIKLLNALLSEAIKQGASDIHIETFEDQLVVRFRIDGVLREVLNPQRVLAPLIVSRIKVMAKLDIAEKRLPQDGRIALKVAGHAVDIRVSTLPSSYGERVVLRILDKKSSHLNLTDLGMGEETRLAIEALINKPHGILLVTGPTGSGKTTTLYAALTKLNDVSRNILTVEDPIEYYLSGIGQTQVNTKVGMTFAKGLRSILRQDPDVVMVGEIRDYETAEIAVQASLTGHLVLSTLHTNSAIGAITRLRDMGVQPFLLSSSVIGVLAQRLVRLLCPECKKPQLATDKECEILNIDKSHAPQLYHPVGCEVCNHLGYLGRTGIYELINIDEKLRTMIHEDFSEQDMEAYARSLMPSIRGDGLRRVLAGDTSLEEVLRVSSTT